MFVPKRSIKYPCIKVLLHWNFYLQLPVCSISGSIATVQHLCLWAWEGSQVCTQDGAIMDLYYGATQTVTAKASQWDCLTFREILDLKPRVHDTFTYAQVRTSKAPCIASEEKWDIPTQTGDRKSGLWKIKVVFPLTAGRLCSECAAHHIILLSPQANPGFLLTTATFTPFKRCSFVIVSLTGGNTHFLP